MDLKAAVLKVVVQPLADKDKQNSPFSREKGEFCVVTRENAKTTP